MTEYITALVFLGFVTVFPAMAWGLVYEPQLPQWFNVLTFCVFVAPFLAIAILFVDAQTLGFLAPFVLSAMDAKP